MKISQGAKRSDDSGFTLVELLISMVVFGIAVSLVYSVLIKVQTYTSDTERSSEAASQVRLALAQIDRQVRSGNVLYSPANEPASLASCTATGTNAGSCMRVYTQANGAERCVQWQVIREVDAGLAASASPRTDRSLLRSRSWATTWQTDSNFTPWAVQARGLSLAPVKPPFALSSLSGTSTANSSRLLDVQFEAVDSRKGATNSVISASLAGRNTNYGYDAGLCVPAPPA